MDLLGKEKVTINEEKNVSQKLLGFVFPSTN